MVADDEYAQVLATPTPSIRHLQDIIVAGVQDGSLQKPTAQPSASQADTPVTLLGHCSERTCKPDSMKKWQQVFTWCGLTLDTPNIGCCGMAGTFSHEKEHLRESKELFTMSWQKHCADDNNKTVCATGFSCAIKWHAVRISILPIR